MQHPASGQGTSTVTTHWTSGTDLSGKDNLHAFSALAQAGTGLALRTGGLPGGPIDGEMPLIETFVCFGLPTVVRQDRTEQFDPLLVTADQEVSVYIARIDDVFLRLEFSLDQLRLHGGGQVHILHIRHGRLHLYNELKDGSCLGPLTRLQRTRFSQMNFIPEPDHLPLLARSCYGAHRGNGRSLRPLGGLLAI